MEYKIINFINTRLNDLDDLIYMFQIQDWELSWKEFLEQIKVEVSKRLDELKEDCDFDEDIEEV